MAESMAKSLGFHNLKDILLSQQHFFLHGEHKYLKMILLDK